MKKGFTLLEMLMVLLILGILATVAVPQYHVAVSSVRYNRGRQIAEEVFRAEKAYQLAHGRVTAMLSNLSLSYPVDYANYYDKQGTPSLHPDSLDEVVGALYYLKNGDKLSIIDMEILHIVYEVKGQPIRYKLYYLPESQAVLRACSVTARTLDPVEYQKGVDLCRALGAEEDPDSVDSPYGLQFRW